MYQAHFGLEKRLFEEGIAAEVFRSAQHEQLIARFKLALGSATSVIALRGAAGVGKSTLTSAALRASSTRLAIAWLNGTPANAAELLELVLIELGVNAARATRVERLQLWRQFQSEMGATESRLFVVVERTEDHSAEVLHALDSLTAADAAGHPGANVVLLGHPDLDTHLAAPVLDSLRQRIRLRAELKPFAEAELQEYLRHQIACAGGDYERLCAPGTVAALHRYSAGVARLANNLCETALSLTASRGRGLLTPELVREAAVELLGLADPTPPFAAPATKVAVMPSATAPSAPPAAGASVTAIPPVATAASRPSPPAAEPVRATPPPAASAAPTVASSTPAAAPSAAAPVTSAFAPSAPAPATSAAAPTPVSPPSAAPVAAPPAATAPRSATVPPAAATASLAATPPPSPPVAVATAAVAPPASTPAARVPPTAASTATERPRAAHGPAAVEGPADPQPVAKAAMEFDGEATDIPDVELADFPVLTDAVELPPAAAATPTRPTAPAADKPSAAPSAGLFAAAPAPTPAPAPVVPPAAKAVPPPKPPATPSAPPASKAAPPPAPRVATPLPPSPLNPVPPAAPSAATTPRRVETAYAARTTAVPATAAKSPPPAAASAPPPASTTKPAPVPAPKPAAAAASPSPPARPAPEPADEEDVLKQTQTLRAIAAARSIDDISSSMAETLFGDAEVDLLTAALAAAAGWSEEESAPTPTPAPAAAAPPKPTAKGATKPAASPAPEGEDDLLDLLGLGDGAPLELIDDAAPAGGDRGRKAS